MQAGAEKGSDLLAAQPCSRTNQPLSPSHGAGQGFDTSTCKPLARAAASLLAQLLTVSAPAQGEPAATHHHPNLLLSQEGVY